MLPNKKILLFILLLCSISWVVFAQMQKVQSTSNNQQPVISFTFDDGKTSDLAGIKLQQWHGGILKALEKHRIKAIMYVAGHNKRTTNGKYVLSSWVQAGHYLANHTLNHPNFNDEATTLEVYKKELMDNEALLKQYPRFIKYFRFPYLKEGNTDEKINGFRTFLKQQGYGHGHVTIDNSDWYIDSRLRKRLTENPQADLNGFKEFYLNHIYEKAMYYDSMATALTNRKIAHSLLLHHNLVAGLFLDDLIAHFKSKGWKVIDAQEALVDPIYKVQPKINPAGESVVWGMAKQTGKYDQQLRYPAEGDQYEKAVMDALGL